MARANMHLLRVLYLDVLLLCCVDFKNEEAKPILLYIVVFLIIITMNFYIV